MVYESASSPSGIPVTAGVTGLITFDTAPLVTQTISRYVIKEDGTIGAEADFTYEISGGGGGGGGIQSPLGIRRNPSNGIRRT